jgi:hypothetical protein
VVCGTDGGVGYWGGIVFYGDDAIESIIHNAYKYSSNSVLENVRIINAGVAAYQYSYRDSRIAAVTIRRASPIITNVSIVDSGYAGIQMYNVHGDAHFSGLIVRNSSSRGITGSCSWQFQCYGCELYDTGDYGIRVDSIGQILANSTQTYQGSLSSLTSYFIDDRGAYINFTTPSGYHSTYSFEISIETTPGYGLAISPQNIYYSYYRMATARIIDGITGTSYQFYGTVTIPSHKVIILIDIFWYWYGYWYGRTGFYGDDGGFGAFVWRYPIGSRSQSLINCNIVGRGRTRAGVHMSGDTGVKSIVNTVIKGAENYGVYLSGSANRVLIASIDARKNNENSTTYTGIQVYSTQGTLDVTDCHVEGCDYGIRISSIGYSNVSLSHSIFRRNRYEGANLFWNVDQYGYIVNSSDNVWKVSNCTFTDSEVTTGLNIEVYDSHSFTTARLYVTENVFKRNKQGVRLNRGHYGISVIIARNTFSDNDGDCCTGSLEVTDRFYYTSRTYVHTPVVIERNIFTRNNGQFIVQLSTESSYGSLHQYSGSLLVFRNNNLTGNSLSSSSSSKAYTASTPNAIVVITGTLATTVYHNLFNNPDADKELAVRVEGLSSLHKINATLNWWGTTSVDTIAEKIYDFDDQNNLAVANYFPYLMSPSASNVSSNNERRHPSFLKNNSEIGGQLAVDFTLSASGSPYTVTRDISVLPNATLTIEEGTTLVFQANIGALIEGSLITKGTPDSPVIFTSQPAPLVPTASTDLKTMVRLVEGEYYGWSAHGYIELRLNGTWQPLCIRSLYYDYSSWDRITNLACRNIGYSSGNYRDYMWWESRPWFPALGYPIVQNISCPANVTSFDDCTYTTSTYAPHSRCLQVLQIHCYCWDCYDNTIQFNAETTPTWAGVRFVPSSSIQTKDSGHRTPTSFLNYTEIRNAGRKFYETVPSVQAMFRPPKTNGLTIVNSVSTAMEVSFLHEESVISGIDIVSANGDGLAIHRPRGQNLTIQSVTVRNVTGAGIHVFGWSRYLSMKFDYQSVCSGQSSISIDAVEGSYLGLSRDDFLPDITCSVVLQGPPDTVLYIRILTLRLSSDDFLYILDGNQSNSLYSHRANDTHSPQDFILSSSNNVHVVVRTGHGQGQGSSEFALYIDAMPVVTHPPLVTITDSSVYNALYGVDLEGLADDAKIENVTVVDAMDSGVYIGSLEGDLTIADCTITNSGNYGIYDEYRKGWKTVIVGNEIIDSFRGIYINTYLYEYTEYNNRPSSCEFTVSGNTISNATSSAVYHYLSYSHYYYYDNYDIDSANSCHVNISGNSLMSSTNGLLLDSYSPYRSDLFFPHYSFSSPYLYVGNNIFSDNNGADVKIGRDYLDVKITSNTFDGHQAGSEGCLSLEGSAKSLQVTGNSFMHNRGAYVVRIASDKNADSPFVFMDNNLINNTVSYNLSRSREDTRPAVLVVANSDRFIIRNNHFNNPDSLFELGVEIPVQSSVERVIDVSGNYWGTTDENVIVDRIHDFGYCSRLASAKYFPHLTSPSGQAVAPTARSTSIIRSGDGGTVRGRVASNTTLSAAGSPYVVIGDISVLPGRTLIIEAGVELRFTHNTGILVEGQLVIDGTVMSPVLLTDNNLVAATQKAKGGLRLVGGSTPESGRVEIFHEGTWGSVCAVRDQKDWWLWWWDFNHDHFNGIVVCRELGFRGAYWTTTYSNVSKNNSHESAWLQHVLCKGSEESLKQCTNYILKKATCQYGQLVVECYGPAIDQQKSDKSLTHWTGIRFAAGATGISFLRHVVIDSAGIANGGHIPALQCIGAKVDFFNVTVNNSAWTAMEVTRSPLLNVFHSTFSNSNGNGVRLIGMAGSFITSMASQNNMGHGLAITSDNVLQRMWNIPVLYDNIVDICAHSKRLSASMPFFLRYSRTGSGTHRDCTADIEASPGNVLYLHVMAFRLEDWWHSHVNIDRHDLHWNFYFPSDFSLHYRSEEGFMSVQVYDHFSDSSDSSVQRQENYFLAYVEQHPKEGTSGNTHRIANTSLIGNRLSGLAVNTSDSSGERYDLHLTDSTVSDNSFAGIDVVATEDGSNNSPIHTFQFRNNAVSHNGRLFDTRYLYKERMGGLAMTLDKSNVVVQNNTFEANRGGGIAIRFVWDSGDTFTNVSDNRVSETIEGAAVSFDTTRSTSWWPWKGFDFDFTESPTHYQSYYWTQTPTDYPWYHWTQTPASPTKFGPTGSPSNGKIGAKVSVSNNSISHNPTGIKYDTLSITNVHAAVTGNTFFNNTCRYVIYWKTESELTATDQDCSGNTIYRNAGQDHNYKSTILADGVGPNYNKNIFFNPANTYEFVAGKNLDQDQENHNVTNNWWGPNIRNARQAEGRVLARGSTGITVRPIDLVNPWLHKSICPPGWSRIDSKCYLYVQDVKNWDGATTYCSTLGGHLATFVLPAVYTKFLRPRSATKGIWISVSNSSCKIQINTSTTTTNCNSRYTFLCQIMLSIMYPPLPTYTTPGTGHFEL